MNNKVIYTILIMVGTFFFTLGMVFVVFLFWPDDDKEEVAKQETVVEETVDEDEAPASEDGQIDDESSAAAGTMEDSGKEDTSGQEASSENNASVNIPASELSKSKLRFRTTSLDGNKVTQDIFSDYDITIVHVWGTYCGACINGMPDYVALDRELPGNVNLIGLIVDTYDGIDNNVSYAEEIMSSAGAQFMNLRFSDDLYDVVSGIQVIPTSFLVDREGHIIGKMMAGQSCSKVKKRLESYLN
ncbi:MAG: TlpA family protein disulfide reductase [Lachnospiraceae bacterium]|nr:TlpA family protein disulfide reductase [Lachnospiraceae bacterium]